MKTEKRYRRVDGMAVLAGLSCVLVVLFESVFMFELYEHVPDRFLSLLQDPPPAESPE